MFGLTSYREERKQELCSISPEGVASVHKDLIDIRQQLDKKLEGIAKNSMMQEEKKLQQQFLHYTLVYLSNGGNIDTLREALLKK